MPVIRKREIREMPAEVRKKKLEELRTELVRLRTRVQSGGTIENPSRVREIRRTIARILTLEKQQEVAGAAAKPEPEEVAK